MAEPKSYVINILKSGAESNMDIDHNFQSNLRPIVGEYIMTSKMKYPMKVVQVLIDYRQVDKYDFDDDGRGGEMLFIKVEY